MSSKVLGNARLTFDEFLTVLIEVEATLNSRLLKYDYSNPTEKVLTPAHLIHGRKITTLPDLQDDDEEEVGIRRRYRHLSKRLQHFWRRWQREYLTGLRESHDCTATGIRKVPKVSDVVTVFEDGVMRNKWKTAVVESLILGKDEQVRGANVRVITKGKIVRLSRPVQKLHPIEVQSYQKSPERGPVHSV